MAYHGTELSRLSDELTQYRDLYTNSEQRCANLQAQLTDLLEELEAKAPQVAAQRENYEKLILAYNELKTSALRLEENEKAYATQVELQQKSLDKVKQSYVDQQLENRQLKDAQIQLQAEVSKLKVGASNQLRPFRSAAAAASESGGTHTKELEDIISDHARLKIELERMSMENRRLQTLLDESGSPVDALIGYRYDTRHPDINQLFILHQKQKVQLDQLQSRYDSKSEQVAALQNELQTVSAERDRIQASLGTKQQDFDKTLKAKGEFEVRLQSLVIESQMKDKQIKSKTDKVNELTLQIAELRNENVQTTLRERDAAYRQVQETDTRLRHEFNLERQTLLGKISELETSAGSSVHHELLTVKTMYEHLQAQYAFLATQQNSMHGLMSVQSGDDRVMLAQVQSSQADLEVLRENLAMAQEEALTSRVLALELDEKLQACQVDLEHVTIENQNAQDDNEGLNAQVQELQTTVNEKSAELEQAQAQSAEHLTSLQQALTQLTEAQQQVAAAATEKTTIAVQEQERLDQAVAAAQAERQGAMDTLTAAHSQALSEATAKATAAETQRAAAAGEVASLQTQLAELQGQLESAQTAHEQEVSELHASMAESEQPMQVEAAAPIPNETINRLLALVQWTLDQDIQTIEVEASEDDENEDEDDAEDEEVSEEAPDSNV